MAHPKISVDRELGELGARLESLSVDFKEEREQAGNFRHDLRTVINSLTESVRVLTEDMKMTKPLMDDYREHRAERRGAAEVTAGLKKWVAGAMISASGIFGAIINEIWKFLTHGGGPTPHP